MAAGVAAFLRGGPEGELAGPVANVKAGAKATRSGPGDALNFIGALTAYCWPIAAIAAIVTVPRRSGEIVFSRAAG